MNQPERRNYDSNWSDLKYGPTIPSRYQNQIQYRGKLSKGANFRLRKDCEKI